jgi:hypothetical protein
MKGTNEERVLICGIDIDEFLCETKKDEEARQTVKFDEDTDEGVSVLAQVTVTAIAVALMFGLIGSFDAFARLADYYSQPTTEVSK